MLVEREIVINAAKSLGLLDNSGELVKLDSLMIVDFLIAIEDVVHVQIPLTNLTEETFRTVDSVTQMVSEVRRSAAASAE
jgi:acyl carrier protein